MTEDSQRSDDAPIADLARALGHELGEIAALLDGYMELLGPSPPPDAVQGLRVAIARLRGIDEDLLEFMGVAATRPVRSAVDPAEALAAAQEQLRSGAGAAVADARAASTLPAVLADPAQLAQLFVHLLRSAARSKPLPDQPHLVIRGTREGPDVRLDLAADDARVGWGVAPAMSSHIAARNGGRLWMEGNERSGTTISVRLPAA